MASAGSAAAVKPGTSNEVRLPYYPIIRRDLRQQPHDHELQLPCQRMNGTSILVDRLYCGYELGKSWAMLRSSTMAL
jgi:hypothetical protein